jgi:hypothetical protein
MTAPAAPRITGHFDGAKVRVRWQPVANATDYKVYFGAATNPSGLQDDVNFAEQGSDGWFHYNYRVDEAPLFIAVTALNIGAEESAKSNELNIPSFGASGTRHRTSDPFGAYDKRD